MKYAVFTFAAIGVPPLMFLLYINRRWLKYALWGMAAAMCLYIPTSINFFSDETYRGSARGMEVSLIHLLSFALIGAISLRRKFSGWFPETGYRIYLIYFLLCLPSLFAAESLMTSWYELWKMIMLYFFYLAIYTYLKATDDVESVLGVVAAFAVINMTRIAGDHLSGIYQPHGVFEHQNSMAVAMLMFTSLLFACYLTKGLRGKFAKIAAAGFVCAGAAVARSFSRGALALMPVALGLTAASCIFYGKARGSFKRLLPAALLGLAALAAMAPRIVERFLEAPEASGNTRIELAKCAKEMIADRPLFGVGINNWGIKINPPYDYAERAGRETNRGEDFKDGIVETVYLLVGAECGLLALAAMLAWFGWYLFSCFKLMKRLRGTKWFFVPAGLAGGLVASYLQSCLEWVLRQQLNMICLMLAFAVISYLNSNWRELRANEERKVLV